MDREVEFPNLKALLAAHGISQKELSELMREKGVICNPSSLSQKINGKRSFKLSEMKAISDITKKDPISLFFECKYTKCERGVVS